MRYIGIDVGTKRTGISISDETATFAKSLAVVDTQEIVDVVLSYAREYNVLHIVIGNGADLSNTPMPRVAKKVNVLAEALKKEEFKVFFQEEAYSSVEAKRIDGEGGDDKAAAIILQRFLETLRSKKN